MALHTLKLMQCVRITDVWALAGCARLHMLQLCWCKNLTDVSAPGCALLHTPDLHGSKGLTDVSGLRGAARAQTSRVRAIDGRLGLANCATLHTLYLNSTAVTDVSALAGCATLRRLTLWRSVDREKQGLGPLDVSALPRGIVRWNPT